MSAEPAPGKRVLASDKVERALLGILVFLEEPRYTLSAQTRGLRRESFFWQRFGDLFEAALSLAKQGRSLNPLTVQAEVERIGLKPWASADIDRLFANAALVGGAMDPGTLGEYVRLVVELAEARERREAIFRLLEANDRIGAENWASAFESVRDILEPPRRATVSRGHLILVSENGEVTRQEPIETAEGCTACQDSQDVIKGHERIIRGLNVKIAKLERDREADAQASPLWPVAVWLFQRWQAMTGRSRSPWTYLRFEAVAPYLSAYGGLRCEQAITGVSWDPFVSPTPARNGSFPVYNDFEQPFGSPKKFEAACNRSPRPFESLMPKELREAAQPKGRQNRDAEARLLAAVPAKPEAVLAEKAVSA